MKSLQPPKVATWLLSHFGCSPNNDAVIGDLAERYRQGKTAEWYWRQVWVATVSSLATEVRNNKLLTLRAVGIGFTAFFLFVRLNRAIYPSTFPIVGSSDSVWSSTGLGDLLRFFHTHQNVFPIASIVIWCAGCASIGWILARLHRPHGKAMVLAFVASFSIVAIPLDCFIPLFAVLTGQTPRSAVAMFVLGDVIALLSVMFGAGLFSSRPGNSPQVKLA